MPQVIMYFRGWASGLPRRTKQFILLIFDFFALAFSVWAAYSLRLGDVVQPNPDQVALMFAASVVAIPVFVRMGLYRSVIRYLPEHAIWTIAAATTIAALLWVMVLFYFQISWHVSIPRSVPAIYALIAFAMIAGSRFGIKRLLRIPSSGNGTSQVLIYGAGAAGAQLATALSRESSKFVVGFLDDNPALQGHDVAGIRVYPPADLSVLIEGTEGVEVVLCMPSASAARRKEIVDSLSSHSVRIRTLPSLAELTAGRYLVSQIREVRIDDVLGRSSVPADPELLKEIVENRSILVSGAGGSIGGELCKLIVKLRPRLLVLFEANEFALYTINKVLQERTGTLVIPVLGSVTDEALVRRTLKTHAIQIVFHAAAHKHVPLLESNALEGIRNNVLGTETIARSAFDVGVEHFVLISTDKAVRPSNVMGATKRWAEVITRYYAGRAEQKKTGQKFCAVRFGNVLGSNGSVVPLFKEQIANGGPVTVTDPEMTRYFMSISEATELIVQAGALSEGGDTFLLEMGEPVRIMDLAENMVRLSGLTVRSPENPNGDIAISFIGGRSGEKIHEELFYDPANVTPTRHPKIVKAYRQSQPIANLSEELGALAKTLSAGDELDARRVLFDLVQERDERSLSGTVVSLRPTMPK